MRDWHLGVFGALLLASINVWGWRSSEREPDRTAYEFRVASYPDDDMPLAMNRDAKDGWRPVTCLRAVEEVSQQTIVQERVTRALYECIMERPKR